MSKVRVRLLRHLEPAAFERPIIKRLMEHQDLIFNDLANRRSDEAFKRELGRSLLPGIAIGIVLIWVAWSMLHVYLPGLIDLGHVVLLGITSTVIFILPFLHLFRAED